MEDIKENFILYQKNRFRDALTNWKKLTTTILKKINVSFIVHFCLEEYSISLNNF